MSEGEGGVLNPHVYSFIAGIVFGAAFMFFVKVEMARRE